MTDTPLVKDAAEFRVLRSLGCRVSLNAPGKFAFYWPDDVGGGLAAYLPRHFAALAKRTGLYREPMTRVVG